jgi:hypothetical protein
MAVIFSKCPKNITNVSLQGPPKFTQIEIFGLKIYHLATLHGTRDRCYYFTNILEEKFSEKMAVFVKNTASFCKHWIITLVFKKDVNFCCPKLV